jgi:hypothetical protein
MIRVLLGFASISAVHAVQMVWFKNQGNKFLKLLKPTWHKKRGRNDVKVNGDELVHEMQDERFRQLQAETLSEALWKKASEYAQEFPEEKFPDAKWDTLWNMAKLFFKRQELQEKEISSKKLFSQVLKAERQVIQDAERLSKRNSELEADFQSKLQVQQDFQSKVQAQLGVQSDVEDGIAVEKHNKIDIKHQLYKRYPDADKEVLDYAFGVLVNLPAARDIVKFEQQLRDWANQGFFGQKYVVASEREVAQILNKLDEELDWSMLAEEDQQTVLLARSSLGAKFGEGQKIDSQPFWSETPAEVMQQAESVKLEFMKLLQVGVSPSTSNNLCLPASIAQWASNKGWESVDSVKREQLLAQYTESKKRVVYELHQSPDPKTRALMDTYSEFAPSDAPVVKLFIEDLLTDSTHHKRDERIAVHFLANFYEDNYYVERTVYVNEDNHEGQLHNCYILIHNSHYSILRPTSPDHFFYAESEKLDAFKLKSEEEDAQLQAAGLDLLLDMQFDEWRGEFGDSADEFKRYLVANEDKKDEFFHVITLTGSERSGRLQKMIAEFHGVSSRSSQYVSGGSRGLRPDPNDKRVKKMRSEEHEMDTVLFDEAFKEFARNPKYSQELKDKGALESFQQCYKSSKLHMQTFQQAFTNAAIGSDVLLKELVQSHLKGLVSRSKNQKHQKIIKPVPVFHSFDQIIVRH